MKRRFWIGGVLLLMIFTGMTGCGGPKEPPPEHMLDGPDMMYTPEDQTPYAGTWQSRDGTIVMKVERGGGAESESDMSLSVNGEPEFEAKLWVYSTGHVELLRGKEKVSISGTFCDLRFSFYFIEGIAGNDVMHCAAFFLRRTFHLVTLAFHDFADLLFLCVSQVQVFKHHVVMRGELAVVVHHRFSIRWCSCCSVSSMSQVRSTQRQSRGNKQSSQFTHNFYPFFQLFLRHSCDSYAM